MSKVLLEMHVAEAYSQQIPKDDSSGQMKNEDSLKYFIASIFKENNVTEQDVRESVDWYKDHPELFDSVYQEILSNLAVWQSKSKEK